MRPWLRLTVILALVSGAGASIAQAGKRLPWMRSFKLPKLCRLATESSALLGTRLAWRGE